MNANKTEGHPAQYTGNFGESCPRGWLTAAIAKGEKKIRDVNEKKRPWNLRTRGGLLIGTFCGQSLKRRHVRAALEGKRPTDSFSASAS